MKSEKDNVTLDGLATDVRDLAASVREGFDAGTTVAAEVKAAEEARDARVDAVEARLGEIKDSMEKVRVNLPGAEDAKRITGEKLCLGDFILAARFATVHGRKTADEVFPACAEVDVEARKIVSGETEQRFWGEKEQYRTVTTQVDASGGYLVPEQLSSAFIDSTFAQTALSAVQATQINGLTGSPYSVSKLTANPTAYMIGEAAAATESTPTFGKEKFDPRKVAVLWGQSREAQLMTSPSAARVTDAAARRVLALKIDQQALEGTGDEYQVTGLASQSGTNDADFSADPESNAARDLTGYHMARLRHKVEEANADMSTFGTITHTKAKNILSLEGMNVGGATGAADAMNDFAPLQGRWVLTDEQLRALYGPIGHSTQLLATRGAATQCNTYAGPWGDFWTCFWGGLFLQTSNVASIGTGSGQNAFRDDLIYTRLIQLFDAGAVAADRFFISDEFETVRSGA